MRQSECGAARVIILILVLTVVVLLLQVKENHRQEEKAFKDFCDFVDRTSDYTVLTVSPCYYNGCCTACA